MGCDIFLELFPEESFFSTFNMLLWFHCSFSPIVVYHIPGSDNERYSVFSDLKFALIRSLPRIAMNQLGLISNFSNLSFR